MSLMKIKDYTYTIINDGKVPEESSCVLHISYSSLAHNKWQLNILVGLNRSLIN